jgi:hypothetical protein
MKYKNMNQYERTIMDALSKFRPAPIGVRTKPGKMARIWRLGELAAAHGFTHVAGVALKLHNFGMSRIDKSDYYRKRHLGNLACKRAHATRDAGAHCFECGETSGLHCDHIMPIYLGGHPATRQNQQWLCCACNLEKGAKFDAMAILRSTDGEDSPWHRSLNTLSLSLLGIPLP